MEKVVIYQDEDTKVEMYKPFADQLTQMYNTDFRVKPEEIKDVLKTVMHLFSIKGWNILDGMVVSNKVPILSREKIFSVKPEYELFEDAIILLSEYFDNTKGLLSYEERQNIAEMIEQYYETENDFKCLVHFFPEPLYKIDCVMAVHNGNGIICLPLRLNDKDEYIPLYKVEQE